MKKLLSGLMLLAVLTAILQAECSKAEVMKLIDKDFSKSEIASICDISTKSKIVPTVPKSKWIAPTNKVCRANGGKLLEGVCTAKWNDAKAICESVNARLPTVNELKKIIIDCDGIIAKDKSAYLENKEDINYQSCYKKKGFHSLYKIENFSKQPYYWSSTVYKHANNTFWYSNYAYGDISWEDGIYSLYVRCVRDR